MIQPANFRFFFQKGLIVSCCVISMSCSLNCLAEGRFSVAGIQMTSDLTEDGRLDSTSTGFQLEGALDIFDDWEIEASWSKIKGNESFARNQTLDEYNKSWSFGASRYFENWSFSASWVASRDEGEFTGALFKQVQSLDIRSIELGAQYRSTNEGIYFIGEASIASSTQDSESVEARVTDSGIQALRVKGSDSGIGVRAAFGAGVDFEFENWLVSPLVMLDYASVVSGDENLVAYFHSAQNDRVWRSVELDQEKFNTLQLADRNIIFGLQAMSISGLVFSLDYSKSLAASLQSDQITLSVGQTFGD